jgi:hypothetical protein
MALLHLLALVRARLRKLGERLRKLLVLDEND